MNPVHRNYATESMRLDSFKNWPIGLTQKPLDMVDAGFFYTGQGDRVICYFCNGKLKDWPPEDKPWEEHARWFKSCLYVLIMKGEEYVQNIHSRMYKNPAPGDDCCKTSTSPVSSKECYKSNEKRTTRTATTIICKICLEEDVNTCFTPCGHAVACAKCALSIYNKCPMCRKVYTNIMRLYF